jgi:dCTP deaminase
MGVLSDSAILKEIELGNIIIDPFDIKYLNPASIDLTLAPKCKTYKHEIRPVYELFNMNTVIGPHGSAVIGTEKILEILDCKTENETMEFNIPESGFILEPNELYLYACNERIGIGNQLAATVMGKSSLGRLGLDIHICAGFADPGFQGNLVLEMRVIRPLRIYPNMKICQIKFERLEGEVLEPYGMKKGSKYQNQLGVVASKMHKNWSISDIHPVNPMGHTLAKKGELNWWVNDKRISDLFDNTGNGLLGTDAEGWFIANGVDSNKEFPKFTDPPIDGDKYFMYNPNPSDKNIHARFDENENRE